MSMAKQLSTLLSQHELRSERLTVNDSSLRMSLAVGGKTCELINISESGLAFRSPVQFNVNAVVDLDVRIGEDDTIHRGRSKVVWSHPDAGAYAQGVAFVSNHLSENLLNALIEAQTVRSESDRQHSITMALPKDYLLCVFSLRMYLEDLKTRIDALEQRTHAMSEGSKESFTKAVDLVLGREVVPRLVSFGKEIDDHAKTFKSKDQYRTAKEVFRRELHEFYRASSFVERAWNKPLGYAGDYEMMNQIYRNGFEGRTLFARLMHKWGINEPSSRSVRYRRGYLKAKILDAVQRTKGQVVIGSLASGPAREVADFLSDAPPEVVARTSFVLIDQDKEALLNAKRTITDVILRREITAEVNYLPVSVKQVLEGSEAADRLAEVRFNLLYTAGLFDYLTQPVAKMLTKELWGWLAPAGELIVGNFHPSNPSHTIGDFAGEWSLIHRDENQMLDLVSDLGAKAELHFDDQRIDLFLEARK